MSSTFPKGPEARSKAASRAARMPVRCAGRGRPQEPCALPGWKSTHFPEDLRHEVWPRALWPAGSHAFASLRNGPWSTWASGELIPGLLTPKCTPFQSSGLVRERWSPAFHCKDLVYLPRA